MTTKRSISSYTRHIAAPPEKVFPLLCPVREYEWLEPWRGELLYSDSGVAETDCVFAAAPFDAVGREIWTCSRYEPPGRIDYVRMSPHTVIRLELRLEPAGKGTRLTTMLVITSLDDLGDQFVAGCDGETCEAHFKACWIMLDHYLRNGAMLPAAHAAALANGGC